MLVSLSHTNIVEFSDVPSVEGAFLTNCCQVREYCWLLIVTTKHMLALVREKKRPIYTLRLIDVLSSSTSYT